MTRPLTHERRRKISVDLNGYLVVENVLTPDDVATPTKPLTAIRIKVVFVAGGNP